MPDASPAIRTCLRISTSTSPATAPRRTWSRLSSSIRAIAQEFDRFLDLLPEGVAGAEKFVAARFPTPAADGTPCLAEEPPSLHGEIPVPESERALLARLDAYRSYGVGLPAEIDIDALDSERMESWTEDEWARAEFSGLLEMMPARDWPESARDRGRDGTDGVCYLRHRYLRRHPETAVAGPAAEDDFAGCSVWEADDGAWMTDFPAPDGYDGYEEGEPGAEDYRRALTQEELAAIGADEEAEATRQAERLAEQHDARRRFFGFDGDREATEERGENIPARHSRESGNPHGLRGEESRSWIPAFAGMTVVR
jgi:hypothetical protein